jgi:hypothetical protein
VAIDIRAHRISLPFPILALTSAASQSRSSSATTTTIAPHGALMVDATQPAWNGYLLIGALVWDGERCVTPEDADAKGVNPRLYY